MKNNNKSGFFDIDTKINCSDPSHNPPTYLYIPSGKGYKHICPSCGKENIVTSQKFY